MTEVVDYLNQQLGDMAAMDGDGKVFDVLGVLVVTEGGSEETLVRLVDLKDGEARLEPISVFRDPDIYPHLFRSRGSAMEKKAAMAAEEAQS